MSTLRVDNILNSDGSPSSISKMVLETVKSATGTSVDFTGIPSWVKRVTVMFNGVSTNGSSNWLVQIGSGSFETTGYVSGAAGGQTGTAGSSSTSGLILIGASGGAPNNTSGIVTLVLITESTWVSSGNLNENVGRFNASAGNKTLSGTLDRIRITTVNGTDVFDAGTINILYEG